MEVITDFPERIRPGKNSIDWGKTPTHEGSQPPCALQQFVAVF